MIQEVMLKAGIVEKRVPHKSMSPRQMELAALALLKAKPKSKVNRAC